MPISIEDINTTLDIYENTHSWLYIFWTLFEENKDTTREYIKHLQQIKNELLVFEEITIAQDAQEELFEVLKPFIDNFHADTTIPLSLLETQTKSLWNKLYLSINQAETKNPEEIYLLNHIYYEIGKIKTSFLTEEIINQILLHTNPKALNKYLTLISPYKSSLTHNALITLINLTNTQDQDKLKRLEDAINIINEFKIRPPTEHIANPIAESTFPLILEEIQALFQNDHTQEIINSLSNEEPPHTLDLENDLAEEELENPAATEFIHNLLTEEEEPNLINAQLTDEQDRPLIDLILELISLHTTEEIDETLHLLKMSIDLLNAAKLNTYQNLQKLLQQKENIITLSHHALSILSYAGLLTEENAKALCQKPSFAAFIIQFAEEGKLSAELIDQAREHPERILFNDSNTRTTSPFRNFDDTSKASRHALTCLSR